MPYTKTEWVNGITPVNATNLNNIENGIEYITNLVEGSNFVTPTFLNNVLSNYVTINDLDNLEPYTITIYNDEQDEMALKIYSRYTVDHAYTIFEELDPKNINKDKELTNFNFGIGDLGFTIDRKYNETASTKGYLNYLAIGVHPNANNEYYFAITNKIKKIYIGSAFNSDEQFNAYEINLPEKSGSLALLEDIEEAKIFPTTKDYFDDDTTKTAEDFLAEFGTSKEPLIDVDYPVIIKLDNEIIFSNMKGGGTHKFLAFVRTVAQPVYFVFYNLATFQKIHIAVPRSTVLTNNISLSSSSGASYYVEELINKNEYYTKTEINNMVFVSTIVEGSSILRINYDTLNEYKLVELTGYKENVASPNMTTIVFDPSMIGNSYDSAMIFKCIASSWEYNLRIWKETSGSEVVCRWQSDTDYSGNYNFVVTKIIGIGKKV